METTGATSPGFELIALNTLHSSHVRLGRWIRPNIVRQSAECCLDNENILDNPGSLSLTAKTLEWLLDHPVNHVQDITAGLPSNVT